jgi:hypothetical protein
VLVLFPAGVAAGRDHRHHTHKAMGMTKEFKHLPRPTDRGPQLWEIGKLLSDLQCSQGDGWRYQIDNLMALYDYERSKFPLIDGNKYMLRPFDFRQGDESLHAEKMAQGSWYANQPGLEPYRAVTLRRINWNGHYREWSALVVPDDDWWWSSHPKPGNWVGTTDSTYSYFVPCDALMPIPENWTHPGPPKIEHMP